MRKLLVGAVLVGIGTLASSAQAQTQAVNAELLKLHEDLRLTPAQEAAWTAYTRAIAPSRDMAARRKATQDLLPLVPTPRRIALIEATMNADVADFRRQGEAVVAFYNQLTPEQQRTFDLDTLPKPQDDGSAR